VIILAPPDTEWRTLTIHPITDVVIHVITKTDNQKSMEDTLTALTGVAFSFLSYFSLYVSAHVDRSSVRPSVVFAQRFGRRVSNGLHSVRVVCTTMSACRHVNRHPNIHDKTR